MFEFRVLGPPRICTSGGQSIDALVRQAKRTALLAYLAAAIPRGRQRRDKVLALFWPESDAHHARAALSQALYVLRSHLGENAIQSKGDDELALNCEIIWSDCVAFEEHLDAGRPAEALALYGADLLDSFFVSGAPAFEQWLDEERQRLRLRAADGAWQLATAAAEQRRPVEAARWARRASDVVPTDETVARRLITFLHDLGDRAAAIRAYEAFAWRLAHEYELEPSPETRALATRIRNVAPDLPADRPATLPLDPVMGLAVGARRARAPRYSAVVAALTLTATLIWGTVRPRGWPAEPTMHLPLALAAAPPVVAPFRGSTIAVSPVGDLLVYVGLAERGTQLFLRRMDRLEAVPIAHTRGAHLPFFSPDGEWLGFTSGDTVRKLRMPDGLPTTVSLADGPVFGASWGPGDIIVFATAEGLWQVPAGGGVAGALGARTVRGQRYRWPDVLPNGKAAVFTLVDSTGYRLAAISLDDGTVTPLDVEGTNPRFVAAGYLVFAGMDGALFAAPFDPAAVRITGETHRVTERVFVGGGGGAKLGLSRSGMLAYVPDASDHTLVLVDRSGRAETLPLAPRAFNGVRFSPDGRHLALTIKASEATQHDIWLLDLDHRTLRQITTDSGAVSPVWTPDGRRVVFGSNVGGREAGFALHSLSLDVREPTRTVYPRSVGQLPIAITPDGRHLLFERVHSKGQRDVWTLRLDGGGSEKPYLDSRSDERMAAVSSDGRWVAFVSDLTGQDEIYVTHFPVPGTPVRISSEGGGREPLWGRNGHELFYRSNAGIVEVTLRTAPTLSIEKRHLLFDDAPYVSGFYVTAYDVHPDGQRFAMIRRGSNHQGIVVVLNWFEQLHNARD